MIPYRFTEFDDPEPDEERADAAYDARHEQEVAGERPVRDFTDEEWAGIRGADFDDGALARPRVSVDASERGRHRAAGDASDGRLR